MSIRTVRRISQVFFLVLFLWFSITASMGTQFWQLRGWPVNIFLQMDPLVGLGTILTTGTLYAGSAWALAAVVLTVIVGRFFCGWVCPFGTIHQAVGWLGRRRKELPAKLQANRYRPAQAIKYYLLAALLTLAAVELLARLITMPSRQAIVPWAAVLVIVLLLIVLAVLRATRSVAAAVIWTAAFVLVLACGALFSRTRGIYSGILQIGLVDPIPLMYRSVNLFLLPAADSPAHRLWPVTRYYEVSFAIGAVFIAAVLANFAIPRFYCRFICPLGALFGVLGQFSIFRIGRKHRRCNGCAQCQQDCEGACAPAGRIRIAECVLCTNCLKTCPVGTMSYSTGVSAAGEHAAPDISRRGVLISIASGLLAVPLLRLGGKVGPNWYAGVVRPPGALPEEDFLKRCIKCGQCMRVCPTNVIQPAGLDGGIELLWTPVLNNRIGTSGCQYNCVACGNICPTAAIRPITLDEKHGLGRFADRGPIRLGLAFVDRGRCLPWAMNRPCIVCQENCPVSPKAIYIDEVFAPVRDAAVEITSAQGRTVDVATALAPGAYATGDYFLLPPGRTQPVRIEANTDRRLTLAEPLEDIEPGSRGVVQIRLQRPVVDPALCIGCGVCEHECPVSGRRAIYVTAENESRSQDRSLLA